MESVPRSLLSLSVLCVLGAVLLASAGSLLLSARLLPDLPRSSSAASAPARSPLLFGLIALLLPLGYWGWRVLSRPLELLRGPDDVGYIPERGRSRAQTANMVRRRRKKGDLPPVYPNGWFQVLDSHLLPPGAVRNLSVCGKCPSGLSVTVCQCRGSHVS